MALSQRLDLRQSQTLVMTPQLQQAIKLLQLSNLELSEFIDREIEQNPYDKFDKEMENTVIHNIDSSKEKWIQNVESRPYNCCSGALEYP